MNPSKPPQVVELVTHTSRCVNGENVVLRKREWVRSDDPRLAPDGGVKFVYGPEDKANNSSQNNCGTAAPGCNDKNNEDTAKVERGPELEISDAGSGVSLAQREAAAGCGRATEPIFTKPISTKLEPTERISTEIAPDSSSAPPAASIRPTTSLSANLSIPKREPQREVKMSSHKLNEEQDYEDTELEDEEEDDSARPWPITKRTLAAIDDMSPTELEDLIENVDDHERWQELREDAKRRTSQWLSGIKKAEEAPRCQFAKVNGRGCGSPAMKGKTLCYYHAEAQAKREAEEARKLELPTLEDRVSVQLAVVRVCNHLVEKSIDEKTGRAIISALRLAYRNLGDQDSLL